MQRQTPRPERRRGFLSRLLRLAGAILVLLPAGWVALRQVAANAAPELAQQIDNLLERGQAAVAGALPGWEQALRLDGVTQWLADNALPMVDRLPWPPAVAPVAPILLSAFVAGLLVLAALFPRRRRTPPVPVEYSAQALHPAPANFADDALPPNDSARGAILAGWAAVLIFFGGFGAWAATAPLNGAVIGDAVIKVEGNRKSVQHLEGGIVAELSVREGDRVEVGDVLLTLDDGQARAEYDVLAQKRLLLRVTEARLLAEFAGSATIDFPSDFTTEQELLAAQAIEGQRREFESRRQAMAGRELVLAQRATQLGEQIVGHEARERALAKQLTSVETELELLRDLAKKGLTPKTRVLETERTATGLEGEVAGVAASIAQARGGLAEVAEQTAQLRKDQQAEITAALHEVRSELADVEPRMRNAASALGRKVIRSPYSGRVVDLAVFSVGGVIRPGDRILDIVPEETELVVDARVRVEDIADIAPGMKAEVHFTSYKQRLVPLIFGRVAEVSADRLVDERSQLAYYTVLVEVDEDDLAANPEIRLYPGMAATVMITTEERTALDYLLGPLTASLNASFRQK